MKSIERCYCHTCHTFILTIDLNHHKNHDLQHNVTDEQIKRPTTFIKSMSNDKREAQYFFSESTLKCFVQIFRRLQFK